MGLIVHTERDGGIKISGQREMPAWVDREVMIREDDKAMIAYFKRAIRARMF